MYFFKFYCVRFITTDAVNDVLKNIIKLPSKSCIIYDPSLVPDLLSLVKIILSIFIQF